MTDEPEIRTQRLSLRKLTPADAPFMLRLLNEPSFLRHIGDKGVRTLDDARAHIVSGPVASYASHGTGLLLVTLGSDDTPVGVCGLLQRENLDEPDLGFAFVPEYWSRGYALESAQAVIVHARERLGLQRIVAVTGPDNEASIRLLNKLGFDFVRVIDFFGDFSESNLYHLELQGNN